MTEIEPEFYQCVICGSEINHEKSSIEFHLFSDHQLTIDKYEENINSDNVEERVSNFLEKVNLKFNL